MTTKLTTKQKGSIGELAVAADLARRGYQVAFPFGEYGDWDLLLHRTCCTPPSACSNCPRREFERVQVKYSESDGKVLKVRARCHSVTAGKVDKTVVYNADSFEWLAVFDPVSDACYYIDSRQLTGSGGELYLRLVEPLHPNRTIRWASDYQSI